VTLKKLSESGWHLIVIECGLGGELFSRLTKGGIATNQVAVITQTCEWDALVNQCTAMMDQSKAGAGLIINLIPGFDKQVIELAIFSSIGNDKSTFAYGGPPGNASIWAVNYCLDYLRRHIP
jgi:hypothetical protein